MTNLPPAAGNVLSVTLNGITTQYTVPANATLATAATGLAAALNNVPNIQALPMGDRIQLQFQDFSVPGGNVTVSASAAMGSASIFTTQLTAARPVFLDLAATGYHLVQFYGRPINGDWLQLTCIKTNGDEVTLGVTYGTDGTTVGILAQNLVNLINSSRDLESADGLFAADFSDYEPTTTNYNPMAQFYLYARTPGGLASQIQAQTSTSTDNNLSALSTSTNSLQDNLKDLQPRNHLYLSSGTTNLAVNFGLDTTKLPDGWHELTAVAYEGTSVGTQTRVTRTVLIQNTSLTATLSNWPAGSTNATLNQQLQFTVTANTNHISSMELFSTGGSVGMATGQATTTFSVAATNLGLGLHPFYALVTDEAGHRYRTRTAWYRIIQGVVAPNLAYTIAPTVPLIITLADLQAAGLASSQASPSYSITGADATSAQGGTVIYNASNLKYAYPASGTPASDSFHYTVSDGTSTASGTVTITLASLAGPQLTPAGVDGNGHPVISFHGLPGYSYHIQRATTLAPTPDWTNRQAITLPSTGDGSASWTDTNDPIPNPVYYRISYP